MNMTIDRAIQERLQGKTIMARNAEKIFVRAALKIKLKYYFWTQ